MGEKNIYEDTSSVFDSGYENNLSFDENINPVDNLIKKIDEIDISEGKHDMGETNKSDSNIRTIENVSEVELKLKSQDIMKRKDRKNIKSSGDRTNNGSTHKHKNKDRDIFDVLVLISSDDFQVKNLISFFEENSIQVIELKDIGKKFEISRGVVQTEGIAPDKLDESHVRDLINKDYPIRIFRPHLGMIEKKHSNEHAPLVFLDLIGDEHRMSYSLLPHTFHFMNSNEFLYVELDRLDNMLNLLQNNQTQHLNHENDHGFSKPKAYYCSLIVIKNKNKLDKEYSDDEMLEKFVDCQMKYENVSMYLLNTFEVNEFLVEYIKCLSYDLYKRDKLLEKSIYSIGFRTSKVTDDKKDLFRKILMEIPGISLKISNSVVGVFENLNNIWKAYKNYDDKEDMERFISNIEILRDDSTTTRRKIGRVSSRKICAALFSDDPDERVS